MSCSVLEYTSLSSGNVASNNVRGNSKCAFTRTTFVYWELCKYAFSFFFVVICYNVMWFLLDLILRLFYSAYDYCMLLSPMLKPPGYVPFYLLKNVHSGYTPGKRQIKHLHSRQYAVSNLPNDAIKSSALPSTLNLHLRQISRVSCWMVSNAAQDWWAL